MTERRRPVRLATLVARVLGAAPTGSAPAVPDDVWRRVVGQDVARRTRAKRLDGGVLHVTVATSAWAQELRMLAPTLLEKLRRAGLVVKDLRLVVGKVERPSRELTYDLVVRTVPKRTPLPRDLARTVAAVEDDELRTVIEAAARQNLGWQAQAAATSTRRPSRAPRFVEEETARSARTPPTPTSSSRRRGGAT